MAKQNLLTTKEAAEILGITDRSVLNLIKKGELKAIVENGRCLIGNAEVRTVKTLRTARAKEAEKKAKAKAKEAEKKAKAKKGGKK